MALPQFEPPEAADVVTDLHVGAGHSSGGIRAAEDRGDRRVERRVLGFFVRQELIE